MTLGKQAIRSMTIDFSGKIVLVTASSQGIGFGIAKSFYEAGAKVCINSRTQGGVNKAVEALSGSGSKRLFGIHGDIGELVFLKSLVQSIVERFEGSIDILINNNGGPAAGEGLAMTEEQWQDAINRNLLSVIRLSALVVPGMKEKGWGRIINLTSTTAKEPDPGMVLSSVTRAGVAAYSKTLAREVGHFGITVNTILTGGCLTERLYALVRQDIEGTDESLDEAIARITKSIPVQYLPTPDEFAQTILFLASEEAGYLTGAAIPLDGGISRSTF